MLKKSSVRGRQVYFPSERVNIARTVIREVAAPMLSRVSWASAQITCSPPTTLALC